MRVFTLYIRHVINCVCWVEQEKKAQVRCCKKYLCVFFSCSCVCVSLLLPCARALNVHAVNGSSKEGVDAAVGAWMTTVLYRWPEGAATMIVGATRSAGGNRDTVVPILSGDLGICQKIGRRAWTSFGVTNSQPDLILGQVASLSLSCTPCYNEPQTNLTVWDICITCSSWLTRITRHYNSMREFLLVATPCAIVHVLVATHG
jgi:hypothetical protein